MVPFADVQKQIIMQVPAPYRMIVTVGYLIKLPKKIARQNNYLALVPATVWGRWLHKLWKIWRLLPMLRIIKVITVDRNK